MFKEEEVKQRSADWMKVRRGKFTASEIWKLIGTGVKPSKFGENLTDWTDTAQNYILSKVAESFSDQDHELSTAEIRWGNEHEPEARAYYEGIFKEEIEEVGFILWPKNINAGCSPDGLVKEVRGIEIKCPYSLNSHMESFLIKSNADFKIYKPQYFWQVQSSMLFTGYTTWDFISYHPFFKPERRITCIEILADQEAHVTLAQRIEAAVIVRDKIINEIIK